MLLGQEIKSESEQEDWVEGNCYCASFLESLSRHSNKYLKAEEIGILLLELTQFNYDFSLKFINALSACAEKFSLLTQCFLVFAK